MDDRRFYAYGTRTDVPELVGMPRPSLILLNDDDLAYAKIRLDDASLAVAIEHLSKIENPLARSRVWGSAWDSTRDAETAPRAIAAGVTAIVAGSAVFKGGPEAYAANIRALRPQVNA